MKNLKHMLFFAIFCLGILLFPLTSQEVKAEGQNPNEKFAVTIDVTAKKYGAKSGKDCSKAFQKALNKAAKKAKSSERAMVYIPKGTYYISKTLTIDSNVYLKCDPGTVIKKKGKKCLYMLRSEKNGKGKYKNVKNITVEGGIWDAKFIKFNKVSGGSLFFFVHATNIKVLNAELKNNFGTHLIELGGVNGVTVSGCKLHGYKSPNGDPKEAIQLDITKNYTVLPDAKPYDDTPCANVNITGNEIYDYARAIGSHTSVKGIYYNNIVITNNNLHDISSEAIYAFNYINMTVDNNTITRSGSGVVLKSFSPEAPKNLFNRKKGVKATNLNNYNYNDIIQNNTITTVNKTIGQSATTIGVFIYGTDKYPIKGCKVLNNTINSASSATYFKYVSESIFFNNTLTRINNSKGSGKNKDYVVDAIKMLNSSNNTIQTNTINSNSGNSYENGIAFRDSAKNNTITDNTVQKVDKSGVGLYTGSTAAVVNNKINNAGMHGITVVTNSYANIQSNTIDSSTGNGITIVDSSSADIKNNTIMNSSAHGISSSDKSTVSIEGNTVKNNQDIGINLCGGTVNALTNNVVTNNAYKGINIQDNTASNVTGNQLSNPNATSGWEMTVTNSKTSAISLCLVSVSDITAGSTTVTGGARSGFNIVVTINGKEYSTVSTSRGFNSTPGYSITVPALEKGTVVRVVARDGNGNEAYTVTTVK